MTRNTFAKTILAAFAVAVLGTSAFFLQLNATASKSAAPAATTSPLASNATTARPSMIVPRTQPAPGPASSSTPSPAATGTEQVAHVTLSVGTASYTVPVIPGGTVLAVMQTAKSLGFSFESKDYPGMGAFIESINGKKNEADSYWFLYVNGKSSGTGASQTVVHPGDVIEWRYE